MWFSSPVRNFGRRRTCSCQHPGCQHVGTSCTPLGRDQRGGPLETLTCHPAVVIFSYCQCYEAVICLTPPTSLASQHVGGNLNPLGRDQRGDPSETSQALTCHPVVVTYCQPCYEAVICLSMATNPGQSACGGNLHTPWDTVAAVGLQKRYRSWTVT